MPAARRLLIIYNPNAGRRRRRFFSRILSRLQALGCEIVLYETKGPGDAERLMYSIDAVAYDVVVAAGGDGTIREVVNGLAGRAVALGIIPLGTANVLANEMGLAFDAGSLSQSIALGVPTPVFTGVANGNRFLVMAGIGFDARIVENISISVKRVVGKAAYLISALSALVRHRPCSYIVQIDGVDFTAAAVVIAKGHYYGGRFILAKGAHLSSPALQVVLFTRGRRRDLMRYALAVAAGRLHRLAYVRVVPAREVQISGNTHERFHLDGDLSGELPIFATVAPRPLLVLR